ncbi:hypothetical protein BGX20_009136 [Mortierella sp. AD010]|nr:hypothetical protein BGX20_009136 [Mortierella sp. AD010]
MGIPIYLGFEEDSAQNLLSDDHNSGVPLANNSATQTVQLAANDNVGALSSRTIRDENASNRPSRVGSHPRSGSDEEQDSRQDLEQQRRRLQQRIDLQRTRQEQRYQYEAQFAAAGHGSRGREPSVPLPEESPTLNILSQSNMEEESRPQTLSDTYQPIIRNAI